MQGERTVAIACGPRDLQIPGCGTDDRMINVYGQSHRAIDCDPSSLDPIICHDGANGDSKTLQTRPGTAESRCRVEI